MVAYNFKAGFVDPIIKGQKRQTIRLPRKRHARPGEVLQFGFGSRFKPVRFGYGRCDAVHEVRLDFDTDTVTLDDAIIFADDETLDRFAVADGFSTEQLARKGILLRPWRYMRKWWALTHPGVDVFASVLIDWADTFSIEPLK